MKLRSRAGSPKSLPGLSGTCFPSSSLVWLEVVAGGWPGVAGLSAHGSLHGAARVPHSMVAGRPWL